MVKNFLVAALVVLLPVCILFFGIRHTAGDDVIQVAPQIEPINPSQTQDMFADALNSTVIVKYKHLRGLFEVTAIGSGILVQVDGEQYVWTVAHTFKEGNDYGISTDIGIETYRFSTTSRTWEQCYRDAGVINLDPKRDICLLKITDNFPSEIKPCVKFDVREFPLKVGDRVFHVGNIPSQPQVVSEGILSSQLRYIPNPDTTDGFYEAFQFEARIWQGSSGGGVFDLKTGKCIGLANMMSTSNMTYYGVPASTIREWAEENGLERYLPQ